MTRISPDLKIEIRPVPDRQGIRNFSENLEYFSQAHTICANIDPVSLTYETGLNAEDIEYLKEKKCPYPVEDIQYVPGTPHPFWESEIAKISLINSPMFLYPGKSVLDFIKWKYLQVNKYIYKSEDEMLSAVKSQATHYIYDEVSENSIKATAIEKRNNLIKAVSELSPERKREIILIILNEDTANKNTDYLAVRFEDILNDKDLAYKLEVLLSKEAQDITMQALVKTAIHKNVLQRTKQGIFYFESNLGLTEEDVKNFLLIPENQEILLSIKQKIA